MGLDDFTHVAPENVLIALVAPNGLALRMQACVGASTPVAGVDLTFDDSAAGELPMPPGPLTTGTFQPTAYCTTAFPAPGPLTPANPGPASGGISTFASVFNGHSSIGTWSLYVFDRNAAQGGGSIPGGWSLDVNPDVTPFPTVTTPITTPIATTPVPTKKCKKKKAKKRAAAAGCKKKRKKR